MTKPNRMPDVFAPMLATLVEKPFDSPDFLFDIKWDGVRALAFCEGERTRLYSRTGREITHQYPEFSEIHRRLNVGDAVLDGEIIAMTEGGRPSFERLQQRIGLVRPADIRRAVSNVPVDLVLFDLVFVGGRWIGDQPIEDRLEQLAAGVSFDGDVLPSNPIPEAGLALFEAARERDLEGIIAKKLGSHYYPGRRSREWLKIKVVQRITCVIGGWKRGEGSRSSSFGALLVGLYDGDKLRYIGSVGTGFNDAMLRQLMPMLQKLETSDCPFEPPPSLKSIQWVKPHLVCEVEYREMTAAMKLRAPSFKGLRDDVPPEQCTVQTEVI